MSDFYNASNYKNTIIDILTKNQNFVKLMNPPKLASERLSDQDILLGGEWLFEDGKLELQGQVFDHNFVDDTITDEKTFIFVESDIDTITQNMFVDFNLYICIFTYKTLVRISDHSTPSSAEIERLGYNIGHYGNRIDILCDIVHQAINENERLKGISDITPFPRGFCTLYSPNNKYYGKCLKYHITNLCEEDDVCGN